MSPEQSQKKEPAAYALHDDEPRAGDEAAKQCRRRNAARLSRQTGIQISKKINDGFNCSFRQKTLSY